VPRCREATLTHDARCSILDAYARSSTQKLDARCSTRSPVAGREHHSDEYIDEYLDDNFDDTSRAKLDDTYLGTKFEHGPASNEPADRDYRSKLPPRRSIVDDYYLVDDHRLGNDYYLVIDGNDYYLVINHISSTAADEKPEATERFDARRRTRSRTRFVPLDEAEQCADAQRVIRR